MTNDIGPEILINESELFSSLSIESKLFLKNNSIKLYYNKNENVFKQNSPFTHVVYIVNGYCKMFLEGYDKNLILNIVGPGEIIAGPGIWVDNMHHFSLSAINKVDALLIELNSFKKILADNTEFSDKYRASYSARTINAYRKIVSLTQNYMAGRVAGEFLRLSENVFKSDKFDFLLSRQDLADLTSMSKESVCRILKEFKDSGYIEMDGTYVEILDFEKLKELSIRG